MTRVIEGSTFAIGEALGRIGRQAIVGLDRCADWQRLQKWRGGRMLDKLVERTRKTFPAYWDEICGLAAGLMMAPEDVFLWNCRHDLLATAGSASSSIAINRLGGGMIVQKLSDDPVLARGSEIVEIRPEGKPGFLSLYMPACVPGFGFAANRAGVVQIVDNIEGGEFSFGIPGAIIARAVLDAASLPEAVEIVMECERIGSCHHILAAAGEFVMVSIEADPSDCSLVPIANKYWHTNHRLKANATGHMNARRSSVERYASLEKLIRRMPDYPLEEDVLPLLQADEIPLRATDGSAGPTLPSAGGIGTAFFRITPERIHVRLRHRRTIEERHLDVEVDRRSNSALPAEESLHDRNPEGRDQK